MNIPKRNQLMMLVLAERNPYWSRLRHFETGRWVASISTSDLLEITGVCRETPKNWRQGKELSPVKGREVFSNTLAYLKKCAERAHERKAYDAALHTSLREAMEFCSRSFDADDIDIFAIGEALGMSCAQTQKTLDAAIYDSWPLLPAAYYPKPPKDKHERDYAQAEADQYEGVYMVWAKRGTLWMQCPMEVRYLQDVAAGRFLRCKMNVPILHEASKVSSTSEPMLDYWGYDGFAAIREQRVYWTFEKRQRDRNDYFHMITNAAHGAGVLSITLGGSYLTTGQDDAQSIVADEVLIRRVYKETSDPQQTYYRGVMSADARLLSNSSDLDAANARWEEYQRGLARDEALTRQMRRNAS